LERAGTRTGGAGTLAAMARPLPEVEGVIHRDVNAGGVRLHIAEAGEGEPVVLVHGWPQHWYAWRHLIPRLSERYRVIVPDLRGFGWSEAPGHGYNAAQFADDIAELLDVLEIERTHLVAHDWGGVAGFILSLERPERVSRFVAMGTAHPWLSVRLQDLPRFAYQLVIATPVIGRLFLQNALEGFLKDRVWDEQTKRIYTAQFDERERADATVALYRSALTAQGGRLLPGTTAGPGALRLTVPTLFLQGSNDPVIKPEMLHGYEEHADDMTLEVLDGVRHFIPEQVPDELAERLLAFLSE
jgi:pimeloyl-ACP methyl ester carboxylesterase